MSKQRKWRFVVEGAEKFQGGTYSGTRTGEFRVWHVTGGDGVNFAVARIRMVAGRSRRIAPRMTINLLSISSKIPMTFQPWMPLSGKHHMQDMGGYQHESQMHQRYRRLLD